jgi:hypothetical protein
LDVVFRDVEEFGCVGAFFRVGLFDCASTFVAEKVFAFDELKLFLFFFRVVECFVGEAEKIFAYGCY